MGRWYLQANGAIAELADRFLRRFLNGRYDLKILELSPGAGRFTAELVRYAASMDLLDMNADCLAICRERFTYRPLPMRFFQNDGMSCQIITDRDYDLVASFDSMVHMHPDIIQSYVHQLSTKLARNGILWLDHSGKGLRESGHGRI